MRIDQDEERRWARAQLAQWARGELTPEDCSRVLDWVEEFDQLGREQAHELAEWRQRRFMLGLAFLLPMLGAPFFFVLPEDSWAIAPSLALLCGWVFWSLLVVWKREDRKQAEKRMDRMESWLRGDLPSLSRIRVCRRPGAREQ